MASEQAPSRPSFLPEPLAADLSSFGANDTDSTRRNPRRRSDPGLPAPGEDVYLVDPINSSSIVFSRQELLKAQQSDPFCRRIVDGLKEPSSQEEQGGNADGGTRTAGIAVGAECEVLLQWDLSGRTTRIAAAPKRSGARRAYPDSWLRAYVSAGCR
ncbi:hypothetical protein HPB49_017015 [Dermacentor silvarum]|uniref:Uncharacterized protein n=1 Tax=Dermacentor silvarum TaxID=543639 RepID=A0ACB8E2H1_DERSI|nr:hypothetical protein HPB49_017015 [Dermacentor silvarum]